MAARRLLLLVLILVAALGAGLWLLREPPGIEVAGGSGADGSAHSAGAADLLTDPDLDGSAGAEDGARSDLITIRGRVIHAGIGRGLEGFRVRLWTTLGIAGETESDEHGYFGFPASTDPAAWVQVVALEGWAIKTDTIDISADKLVFRALPEVRGTLGFQFLDAETAEPVPYYTLDLWEQEDSEMYEEIVSDSEGRARTQVAFAGSRLAFREIDHPETTSTRSRHIHSLVQAPSGDEHRPLQLHVGPTYDLELTLPAGLEARQFEAVLVPAQRRYDGSQRNGWPVPLRVSKDADGQPRVWVRFLPWSMMWPFDDPEESGPITLELHESVGRWFGSARVDTVSGIQPGSIAIQLQELAQVRGCVVDSDGKPVGEVSVRLDPAHDAAVRWSFDEQATGANGVFAFKGLFPGAWLLRAQTTDRGLGELALNLTSGERREVDVTLVPVPTAPIRGRVVSENGKYGGDTWLWIEPVDTELLSLGITREVKWNKREEPIREGTFDFGELPIGEYRLQVDSFSDYPWLPSQLVVTNPDLDIELRLMNGAPLGSLAFTLETVPADSIYLRWTQDDLGHEELLTDEFITFPLMRPGAPLDWTLLSEGMLPVQGDETDLRPIPEGPWSGAHVANVAFQPGWGRIVVVRDENQERLPGTTILLDDRRVGETGPESRLIVSADEAPRAVTAQRSGWKVTASRETRWHVWLTLGER